MRLQAIERLELTRRARRRAGARRAGPRLPADRRAGRPARIAGCRGADPLAAPDARAARARPLHRAWPSPPASSSRSGAGSSRPRACSCAAGRTSTRRPRTSRSASTSPPASSPIGELPAVVRAALDDAGIDPHQLTLEITEGLLRRGRRPDPAAAARAQGDRRAPRGRRLRHRLLRPQLPALVPARRAEDRPLVRRRHRSRPRPRAPRARHRRDGPQPAASPS